MYFCYLDSSGIRIYSVDPLHSHEECLTINLRKLEDVDLLTPVESIINNEVIPKIVAKMTGKRLPEHFCLHLKELLYIDRIEELQKLNVMLAPLASEVDIKSVKDKINALMTQHQIEIDKLKVKRNKTEKIEQNSEISHPTKQTDGRRIILFMSFVKIHPKLDYSVNEFKEFLKNSFDLQYQVRKFKDYGQYSFYVSKYIDNQKVIIDIFEALCSMAYSKGIALKEFSFIKESNDPYL